MKQVLGTELREDQKRHALAAFLYRSTKNHVAPGWYQRERYPVQFANDQEWLAHTYFWVRDDGTLSAKHRFCESHPTWPDNPELRKES